MRMDDLREYKLNVEAAGHGDVPRFLRGDTDLSVTAEELLHAVVTCAIPEEGAFGDYPGRAVGDLNRRLSIVEYALDASGEYLRKSGGILELDESIRSTVSYYLGMFFTRLVSGKIYATDYLVPLPNIRQEGGLPGVRYQGRRRADLIGCGGKAAAGNDMVFSVWEAIGRSNNSGPALAEGCRQAGEITEICGREPEAATACMIYYGAKCLSVRVRETEKTELPEGEAEENRQGLALSFSPADYFRAYYRTAYRLLEECYERESLKNRLVMGEDRLEAELVVTGGRRLAVGMPRDIFFAVRDRDDEGLLKAAARLGAKAGEAFADGITVSFR